MPWAEFGDAFDSAIRINPRRDDIPGTIIPDAGYEWDGNPAASLEYQEFPRQWSLR